MAVDNRRRPSKPSRKLPESQSKFDRWLENQVEARRKVSFVFAQNPRPQSHTHFVQTMAECTVIVVDRYMLMVEFHDGETWWVSKSNIVSAGTTVDGR